MATKKYQGDSGSVHRIRLGKDNAAVTTNTEPDDDVDSNVRVKVSKSNREFGLRPRSVGLTREIVATVDDEEVTITKRASLPILTESVFDSEEFSIGRKLTIGEKEWTISNKNPEDT